MRAGVFVEMAVASISSRHAAKCHAVAAGHLCTGQERYLGQLAKALRRALGWRGIFTERRKDECSSGQ